MGYSANRKAQLGLNTQQNAQQNTQPLSYSQRRKQELLNQQKQQPNLTPSQNSGLQAQKEQALKEKNAPKFTAGDVVKAIVKTDPKKMRNQFWGKIGDAIDNPSNNVTPVDQRVKLLNDKSVQNDSRNYVGMNIWPAYKEESSAAKAVKGVVNYGVGGVASIFNNIMGAVPQGMMQTVKNTGNAIEGKPVDFSEKSLRKDILPPEYDKALKDLYSKGVAGQYASEAIDMLVNAGLDPTTYIGGGIVDDMAKAGVVGEASKPSTKFVQVVGERQKALMSGGKQAVKQAGKQTIDEVQDAITTPRPQAETEQLAGELRGLSEKPTNLVQSPKVTEQVNVQPTKTVAENGARESQNELRAVWNKTQGVIDKLRKEKPVKSLETYWTYGNDTDRGYARYIEKYWDELPDNLQEFWGKQSVLDMETGDVIHGYESVRGGHVGQVRRAISEYPDETDVIKSAQNGAQKVVNISDYQPKTPKQQKYVDQVTAKLPDDADSLQKTIDDLEQQRYVEKDGHKLLKINLQLFAAKKKLEQISQFKTNTIARSTMLTDEEKAFLPNDEFKYTVEKGSEWETAARRNIDADAEGTKQKIIDATQMSKEQEFEAAIIAKNLLNKARETKDYSELTKWLSQTSARTREDARALKAVDLAWDKASPEAGIKRAQKIMDGVEDAITKKDPVKMKQIDKGLKQIKDVLENPNLTPQEAVNRIKQIINPKGKTSKATMDKVMEIVNKGKADGKFDYDGIRQILKESNGIPVLTNSEIAQIDELYTKAKEYKPESYEYRMYTEKARKLVEDKVPTDFIDKYRTLQRLSMIFNPKTLLTRNPGGNILLMTLSQVKENTLGAFSDYILTAIREKSLTKAFTSENRTTKFMPIAKAKASLSGAKKGLTEWGKDIKYGVDTNPTHGQMELGKSKAFKGDNPLSKTLNLLDTIEKRALQLGDRPFYEAAYASRAAELKRIRKVSELTDEMKIDAKAYALDKVFQRDSELSKIFGGAKNLSQNVGFKVLANTFLPFSQTPANVLDKMLEYSPVGIGKAIKEIAFPKNGVFNQKYFIDNLSSGLTGSGILVLGYYMYNQGMIKTKAPTSTKERSFEQVEGKGNFALNFGGKYYTIDWAQPVATMLLAGAEAAKGGTKGEDAFKKVLNSITAGGDTFFNMSLLKNVSSVFGTGNSPMGSLINALMGSTTQFTPTMGKQIAQIIDPYVRETYDPNMAKEQYNKILARLPWASKSLPVKRDMMGNEVKAYQGRNNLFNIFLNPGFYTEESKDPAVKEIRRLFDLNKETDLLPGKEALTSGKFSKDKVDYTMTAKEFERFNKTYGDALQNGYSINDIKFPGLNALINTQVYQKLSEKAKAARIKKMYDRAYEQAQKEFFKGRGIK